MEKSAQNEKTLPTGNLWSAVELRSVEHSRPQADARPKVSIEDARPKVRLSERADGNLKDGNLRSAIKDGNNLIIHSFKQKKQ